MEGPLLPHRLKTPTFHTLRDLRGVEMSALGQVCPAEADIATSIGDPHFLQKFEGKD